MCNNYKSFYSPVQLPSIQTIVAYAESIRLGEQRRATSARIAKQQAKLRRAKIAERWIVFTVALMMAIAMLPVLLVVGAIMTARALWRRYTEAREGQRISLPTDNTRMTAHAPLRRGLRELGTPAMSSSPEPFYRRCCAA